jgi:hypothetical protein
MKNITFQKNKSVMILFLLLLVSIVSLRSGGYTNVVNMLFFSSLLIFYRIRLTVYSHIYFLVFSFYTLFGIIRGNNFDSVLEDILSFVPFILLFIENQSVKKDLRINLSRYLSNSLYIMIPVSILIFNYMDYSFGTMSTARFDYDERTKLLLFAPIIPLLYAPFLIFYSDNLTLKQKILVNVANVLIGLFGIITLTKSVFFSFFTPYIIFYLHKLSHLHFLPILKFTFFILVSILVLINTDTLSKIGIIDSVDGIFFRIELDSESAEFDNGRLSEAEDYFRQDLSFVEILFGRGMGGHKVRYDTDSYIGGVNMMHIGVAHVFLKGGIFLVMILYVPVFLAILRFWNTSDYYISLILLLWLINNFQTSTWYWGINAFFYWFALSSYLKLQMTNKRKLKLL